MPLRMMSCDLLPFDVGDEADAAGVVLMLRIVEALRRRQALIWIVALHVRKYSEYHAPHTL